MHIHSSQNLGLILGTLYFHSQENLMRGWIYRNVIYIFSFPTIFGGGEYIVTLYFHPWQYLVRGWIYRDIIFSLLTIFGEGGDYIVTLYFHSWQYLVRGWLYRDIIFSLLAIFLVRGCLYRDMIFSPLTIFGHGVIISWHDIFTPDNIWWEGDYIVTSYFHSWQYLVRGWWYRDIIFSLLTIFGEGVIMSWHYIIVPDTTLESGTGVDYIWIFSLSKFDSAGITGFYYSYPYIHPMKLGGLKWLCLSMIPSLLLKLSVLVGMLMDCINSLWWTKICKKS